MLEIFYQSVVTSALFFAVVCWRSSTGADDTNRLNKVIKKASSIISCKPDTFEVAAERRTPNKLLSIMDNPDHPPSLPTTYWSDSGALSLTDCLPVLICIFTVYFLFPATPG